MTTNLTPSLANEIATFAIRYQVTPHAARALPYTFSQAAEAAGKSVRGIVADATYNNHPLGEYIAQVATKAMEGVAAL